MPRKRTFPTVKGGVCKVGDNAGRERTRIQNLRIAFLQLQKCLPQVPPDTKLSKLHTLTLATEYIARLSQLLETGKTESPCDALPDSTSSSNRRWPRWWQSMMGQAPSDATVVRKPTGILYSGGRPGVAREDQQP
ncbi:unnamed protein product [Darwinula stevensoni]|uniref:BHLH domain-containing protein n=1 Tax=Darwinula stevensoni TaxID=69355 RepID=A0A7R8XBJ2_9CRUS|nr:unnamed protein product [Darwinula stevensoni]CAG0884866.1 unnamed protein product [Darwinula stevensoni]